MGKWIGIARTDDRKIVAVNITDKEGANMPFGDHDWVQAIEGNATAIAVVEVPDDSQNLMVVDCGMDEEARNYYHDI